MRPIPRHHRSSFRNTPGPRAIPRTLRPYLSPDSPRSKPGTLPPHRPRPAARPISKWDTLPNSSPSSSPAFKPATPSSTSAMPTRWSSSTELSPWSPAGPDTAPHALPDQPIDPFPGLEGGKEITLNPGDIARGTPLASPIGSSSPPGTTVTYLVFKQK